MNRAHVADTVFRNYDFGYRVDVEDEIDKDQVEGFLAPDIKDRFETESRAWQEAGDKWVRPAYVILDGGGDQPFWVRLEFTVIFYRASDEVKDVYAFESDGSIWGRMREGKLTWEWQHPPDESLVKGPWAWRQITDDKDETVAMILETTARPMNDPVILQALVCDRSLTIGQGAAASELIRLAPEMLYLLAQIVHRSKKAPDQVAECIEEAKYILDSLASHHCRVDWRLPGYWSAEDD